MKNLMLIGLKYCLVFLCFASSLAHAAPAPESNTPAQGSLVIIGGALRNDNAPVWKKIIQLAGGKGAKIVVIPAAAGNPERSGKALVSTINRYGAQAWMLPLSVKLPDYRAVAEDAQFAAQIRSAGGVYFAGGDQARITQALLRADGSKSAVLQAIWDMYQKGGVIAGSSAGAAIMSSTMFYDAMPVLPTLQLGVRDGKEIAPGLGFIGDQVFIDQHLIIRGRFARMLPVMLKKNYKLGLGVDENTAIIVRNRHQVEVLGYKGAIVLDLAQAQTDSQQKAFNVKNVSISYLDNGDQFHLLTKRILPAKDKEKLDPQKPYFSAPRFFPDILGNTAVADLMHDLIDNQQQSVIGLAFGASDGERANEGFEFTFSKTKDSVGYFSSSSGSESYTVGNIRLDIRPVQMAQPLYLPVERNKN